MVTKDPPTNKTFTEKHAASTLAAKAKAKAARDRARVAQEAAAAQADDDEVSVHGSPAAKGNKKKKTPGIPTRHSPRRKAAEPPEERPDDDDEEEEQPPVQEPAKRGRGRPPKSKPATAAKKTKADHDVKQPAANFKEPDDVILARAFVRHTNNLGEGAKEKGEHYWEGLAATHNEIIRQNKSKRPLKSSQQVYNRWKRHLLPAMNKFVPCYRYVKNNPKSGWSNEDDFISGACEEYSNRNNSTFKYVHVVEVLSKLPRFDPCLTPEQAARKENLLVDIEDDDDDDDEVEEVPAPGSRTGSRAPSPAVGSQPTPGVPTAAAAPKAAPKANEVSQVMGQSYKRAMGSKQFKRQPRTIGKCQASRRCS